MTGPQDRETDSPRGRLIAKVRQPDELTGLARTRIFAAFRAPTGERLLIENESDAN